MCFFKYDSYDASNNFREPLKKKYSAWNIIESNYCPNYCKVDQEIGKNKKKEKKNTHHEPRRVLARDRVR